jgi:hypothetical protein
VKNRDKIRKVRRAGKNLLSKKKFPEETNPPQKRNRGKDTSEKSLPDDIIISAAKEYL